MAGKKMTATEKWAAKNKKKTKAKPSDAGSGGASRAAKALSGRQAQIDKALEGYEINGKKVK